MHDFPMFVMGIISIFCDDWIDCRGISNTVFLFVMLCNGLKIGESKATSLSNQ